jgi:hypothetical protein
MSTAETFEAWATGAVATATAVAIVIGGGWALWRYVLPSPLEPTWEIVIRHCWVRRLESGKFKYGVEIMLTNTSATPYVVDEVSFLTHFPGEEASARSKADLGPDQMFKPHVPRRVFPFREDVPTLHQVVNVVGEIKFRQRGFLGLLGWRHHTLVLPARSVPVEANSLALYTGSSKEGDNA